MTLPTHVQDREIQKFQEDSDGNPCVRIIGKDLINFSYDSYKLAYTGDNITTITYTKSGVTMGTLTMGYDTSFITSVTRL
jgi:hypothetical protein